jgi:hypothetical protein
MTWMQFVASLVGDLLAWPVAIVVLVLIFRAQVKELIADVAEGEVGPRGMKFKRGWDRNSRRVQSSASAAETSSQPTGEATAPEVPLYDRYHAVNHPELAIAGARSKISRRLSEMLGRPIGASAQGGDNPVDLARGLVQAGRLTEQVLDSIEGLEVMYNLAQSRPEHVTTEKSQEFQILANAVLYTLRDR